MAKRMVRKKSPRKRMIGANTQAGASQGMTSATNTFGTNQQTAMIEQALSESAQAQSTVGAPIRGVNAGATQGQAGSARAATGAPVRGVNVGATQGRVRGVNAGATQGQAGQAQTGAAQGQAGSATTDFTAAFQQAEQARQQGQQVRGITPHFDGANAYDPQIGYFRVPRGRSGMEVANEIKETLGIGM